MQWVRPTLAQCSAHRCLQDEMLGGAKDAGGVEWSVLILDPFTTKIMSNACRISEILDYGISCEQPNAAVLPRKGARLRSHRCGACRLPL